MSVSTPPTRPNSPADPPEHKGAIPPLKEGDRLTREEFERRYDAMANLGKAELIDGVVHVPSPVRQRRHSAPHLILIGWLFNYRARTSGLEGGVNPSVRLDLGSTPQPDCLLFISPEYGGQAKIDEDDYLSGGPDLVAEMAASSAHYDVHDKFDLYKRHGVREYVVRRVNDRQIDWFVLREGQFENCRQTMTESCAAQSSLASGSPRALCSTMTAALLDVLQRGLQSPEHAAFKDELRRAKVKRASWRKFLITVWGFFGERDRGLIPSELSVLSSLQ